jgi:nicotinamidase-related amidase
MTGGIGAGGTMIRPSDVLIVVDVQNDFCPGGRSPCRAATRW